MIQISVLFRKTSLVSGGRKRLSPASLEEAFVASVACQTRTASDGRCQCLRFILGCAPESHFYQLGTVVLAAVHMTYSRSRN